MDRSPPPTPEQIAQWHAGAQGLRRATRAARVASFSSWTLAIFGVLTALGGLFDPITLAIALAMLAIAWSERIGAARVRSLDAAGPRRLVADQYAILLLVAAYAGVNIARATLGGPPRGLEPTGDAQVDQILGEVTDLTRTITVALYATLAGVGVPVQLCMAWYHARRGRQMTEWTRESPAWIVQMARQHDGAGSSARLAA